MSYVISFILSLISKEISKQDLKRIRSMATLTDYACSFIGKPYAWGGDDPMAGFDCSGLAQEILASVGFDPKGDQTAHQLYEHFKSNGKEQSGAGALAFYGKPERITHVGFMIDNFRMVEAGGGGSRTKTIEDAIKQNAYIRIRPINHRSDLVACLMPDYDKVINL